MMNSHLGSRNIFKQSMKGPIRPAPSAPGCKVNRYSPVTNWNDDPFSADVFEPSEYLQKKKPPPRPPPPKVNSKPVDLPTKPTHFIRKPTVLSSLLSRKSKNSPTNQSDCVNQNNPEFITDLDPNKIFSKCDIKGVQTGALIDLSSPPSSPTFTIRSSSDGLSVDSFGSDGTNSTNHPNTFSGGNVSQTESGFEDDFDLFFNSRKNMVKDDTLDDLRSVDPFSPLPLKPVVSKKNVLNKDIYEVMNQNSVIPHKGPTIIRAKPVRPKPPDNMALLKCTFGNSFPTTSMNVNTAVPIHKVNNVVDNNFKSYGWNIERSPEREESPPMPSVPPPPPPQVIDDDLSAAWPDDDLGDVADTFQPDDADYEDNEPYGIALFDYFTDHPDDLNFTANSRITLIRRENDEWLFGSLKNGVQGLFPSNYIEIKVPLNNEPLTPLPRIGSAVALYDFESTQHGDLSFFTGDTISVIQKINNEWYFGECKGRKGQFPANYVQMN